MIRILGLILVFLSASASANDPIVVWNQFIVDLKKGDFQPDGIRPLRDELLQPSKRTLDHLSGIVNWSELEHPKEVLTSGDKTNYIVTLTHDGSPIDYCFTLVEIDNKWYFQHLEAIFIRLDTIKTFPASHFPDLPDDMKIWIREEDRVSRQVYLFNVLSKEKGSDYALNLFKDGAGYALAAKAWVPFIEPHRAFILYACWEQTYLAGNPVVLQKLDDHEAIIEFTPIYFQLYDNTGHLKQQISFDQYKKLFETIWDDRARNGGWELFIQKQSKEVIFHFKR